MPIALPMPTKNPGDVLTSTLWNTYLRDNINKLLNQGHRVLTVAQFAALTGLEGTKGTIAPDEVYLEVDSTNGIQWHLAYESGEPTYKWRFLGGPPLRSEVTTSESVTATAYSDLATVGPSITLARGGDYDYELGAELTNSGFPPRAALKKGAATAVDADSAVAPAGAASVITSVIRRGRGLAAAASDVWKVQYASPTGAGATIAARRTLTVLPVRLI